MADSNTTTYSFTLPEVGASADSWGTKLNANWDKVDDLLDGSIAVNGITVTGGSIDGTPVGATTPSTGAFTTVTTTGNVDVTGTITADGLTVDGAGSISGNFGVGTTSPARKSHIISPSTVPTLIESTSTASYITLMDSTTTDNLRVRIGSIGDNLITYAGGSERLRIDSSGNVGIGTASPVSKLELSGIGAGAWLTLDRQDTNTNIIDFTQTGTRLGYVGYIGDDLSLNNNKTSNTIFYTSGSERARIDSSGNLLVGKTSANSATQGAQLNADGVVIGAATSKSAGLFNRLSTDGTIIDLRKDGSTVGSIGANSSRPYFAGPVGADVGITTASASPWLLPCDSSGGLTDGVASLGQGTLRWKDLYLSGGVYLGGTGAANKLDDYEEGDFTPSLDAVTVTYSNRSGRYTKIGRMVYVEIYFSISSLDNTDSSGIHISDLPFIARTGSGSIIGSLGINSTLLGTKATQTLGFSSVSNSDVIFIYDTNQAGNNVTYNEINSSGSLNISFMYEANT